MGFIRNCFKRSNSCDIQVILFASPDQGWIVGKYEEIQVILDEYDFSVYDRISINNFINANIIGSWLVLTEGILVILCPNHN